MSLSTRDAAAEPRCFYRAFARRGVDVMGMFREGIEHASIERLMLLSKAPEVDLSEQAKEEATSLFAWAGGGRDESASETASEALTRETAVPLPLPLPASARATTRETRALLKAQQSKPSSPTAADDDARKPPAEQRQTARRTRRSFTGTITRETRSLAASPVRAELLQDMVRIPRFERRLFPPGNQQLVGIASRLASGKLPAERPSVMITSLNYGEGKSALAIGLALELGRTLRVCLVDADLVRPQAAALLGISFEADLLSVLSGDSPLARAITYSEADHLAVIANTGLEGGAADLLGLPEAVQVYDALHELFDCLVVDTPPLRVAADACALAPHLGGTLLVVRSGAAPVADLEQARRELLAAQSFILGTVMTHEDG